jgi:hypothetical protein
VQEAENVEDNSTSFSMDEVEDVSSDEEIEYESDVESIKAKMLK